MHFGDFNPLEVLANAAVQRGESSTEITQENDSSTVAASSQTSGESTSAETDQFTEDTTKDSANPAPDDDKLKPLTVETSEPQAKPSHSLPCVVRMPKTSGQSPVRSIKDGTKILIPKADGTSKTVTVLRLSKAAAKSGLAPCVFERGKADDDEGYCSRSSLDSPDQCIRSDSDVCERDGDMRSPANSAPIKRMSPSVFSPPTPVAPMKKEESKQAAKIVVVSRESTVASVTKVVDSSVGSKNVNVLRTLLRDKSSSVQLVKSASESSDKSSDGSQCSGKESQGKLASVVVLKSSAGLPSANTAQFIPDQTSASHNNSNVNTNCDSSSKTDECLVSVNTKDDSNKIDLVVNNNSVSESDPNVEPSTVENTDETSVCESEVNNFHIDRSDFQCAFKTFIGGDTPSETIEKEDSPQKSFDTAVGSDIQNMNTQDSKKEINDKAALKGIGKEDEEIIDVMSVDESSSKEGLFSVQTQNKVDTSSPQKAPVATPSVLSLRQPTPPHSLAAATTKSSSATLTAKPIPVVINTSNGKRLANVPVNSLLSASTNNGGQSQKPVTYLVMSPQSKAASTTSLLMSQLANNKSQVLEMPKYQYIIQDDVSPVTAKTHLVLNDSTQGSLVQRGSEAYVLATVNQQVGDNKTKFVPVLIKNPVLHASSATTLMQNTVVLSSRAPQSLIPKFVGTSVVSSQQARLMTASKQSLSTTIGTLGAKNQLVLSSNVIQASSHQPTSQATVLNTLSAAEMTNKPSIGEKIVLNTIGSVSSGRSTPVTGRITPLHSLETSPSENKINIKITGSKVTRTSEEVRPRKSTSIGKFGAFSAGWNSPISTAQSRTEINSPVTFGSSTMTSPTSSIEPWSPASLHIKSDSELDVSLDSALQPLSRAGLALARRKNRSASSSQVDFAAIKSGANSVARLHPLIDHDYCSFKEFNAEVQSSIIATTDTKLKIDKYNQRAKAAKIKEALYKLDKKAYGKKRKHSRAMESFRRMRTEKLMDQSDDFGLNGEDDALNSSDTLRVSKASAAKSAHATRRHSHSALERKGETKFRGSSRRGEGKNFVKIPGSYQDDFVYYATKHSRGRTRKHETAVPEQVPLPKPTKKPNVGEINVFDWYRDLSQTDKSVKFGVPDPSTQSASGQSSTVKGGHTPLHESEVADLVMAMLPQDDFCASLPRSDVCSTSGEMIVTNEVSDAHAMNEVEANEMGSQNEDIDHVLSRLLSSMDQSEIDTISQSLKKNLIPPGTEDEVPSALNTDKDPSLDDAKGDSMDASDVRQAENDDISEKEESPAQDSSPAVTENSCDDGEPSAGLKPEPTFADPSDLSEILGPYNPAQNLSQTNTTFDLDDINDDLLPSDLGNMNALIGDLARSSVATITTAIESVFSTSTVDSPLKSSIADDLQQLSVTLCARSDISSANDFLFSTANSQALSSVASRSDFVPPHTASSLAEFELPSERTRTVSDSPVQRPPEMIVVSMFWNDLPGLMIEGKKCVRLVDIHKQMLPAKDTGILKKRCQMMGLEVLNCNEMERDFLIRYANAAKSKSCVVVCKEDAEALVNFYVNPRPRTATQSRSSSGGGSRDSSSERIGEYSRRASLSGASTLSTESDVEYEPPQSTGGKGKARPQTTSDQVAYKGGKGKTQRRKQSPLAAPPPPPAQMPSYHEGAVTPQAALADCPSTSTVSPIATFSHAAQIGSDLACVKRSNRARNKVNYAALNAGLGASEEELEMQQIPLSPEPLEVRRPSVSETNITSPLGVETMFKRPPIVRQNAINIHGSIKGPEGDRYSFPEEHEIRRLRSKQHRKGLDISERRKLKRLKDRLKLKVKKLKKKVDRLRKSNGSQLLTSKNFLVKKALNTVPRPIPPNVNVKSILLPGLKMRLRTQTIEQFNNTVPLTSEAINETLPQEAVVVKTKQDTKDVELIVNSTVNSSVTQPVVSESSTVDSTPKTSTEVVESVSTPAVSIPSSAEVTPSTRPVRRSTERRQKSIDTAPTPASPTEVSTPTRATKSRLPVLHRGSSQRGKHQAGTMHIHLYRTRESACVQCETCSDFLSVRRFLKHLHHQNKVDELCMVTLPQTLELGVLEPLPDQLRLWRQFEVKRDQMDRLFEESKSSVSRSRNTSSTSAVTVTPSRRQSRSQRLSQSSSTTTKAAATPKPADRPSAQIHAQPSAPDAPSPAIPSPDAATNMESARSQSVSGTRHSSRVRKRKQLHPMESYVYSYSSPPGEAGTETKRRRLTSQSDSVDISSPVVACTEHGLPAKKAESRASRSVAAT